MLIPIVLLIIGFVVLIYGADLMVKGASSLANKWGVSPIVVGLTVVAFGTSAPELAVNIFSAVQGSADIAIGNVIGSNIANILLILGISAIIVPMTVQENTVYKEIPFALLGAGLIFTMGNDSLFDHNVFNAITRTDGISLIAMFIIFMYYVFGVAKVEAKEEKVQQYSYLRSSIYVLLGIFGLFVGGKVLVDNAVILARVLGLSEALIGLTVVAIGTSLPELATSVVAAMRKQNDIAIGNIVGSCIFNVFWILGLTSTILQLPFNPAANVDALVGVAASVLLFLAMFTGKKHTLERWQGVLMVLSYVAYIAFLVYRG